MEQKQVNRMQTNHNYDQFGVEGFTCPICGDTHDVSDAITVEVPYSKDGLTCPDVPKVKRSICFYCLAKLLTDRVNKPAPKIEEPSCLHCKADASFRPHVEQIARICKEYDDGLASPCTTLTRIMYALVAISSCTVDFPPNSEEAHECPFAS